MEDLNQDLNINEPDITPCPPSEDSPDLQDSTQWTPYDNQIGSFIFHGGMNGYLENIEPSPERLQQECFYDKEGDLIDEDHEYSGMGGTANQYDGHGDSWLDMWDHFYNDSGGVVKNGAEAVSTSLSYHMDNICSDLSEFIEDFIGEDNEDNGEEL